MQDDSTVDSLPAEGYLAGDDLNYLVKRKRDSRKRQGGGKLTDLKYSHAKRINITSFSEKHRRFRITEINVVELFRWWIHHFWRRPSAGGGHLD
jgi:hypothetical protein